MKRWLKNQKAQDYQDKRLLDISALTVAPMIQKRLESALAMLAHYGDIEWAMK